MSETLRDLVVSLSLQTDNFTRNIRSVQKQIAEAESQFRLAAAGVEGQIRSLAVSALSDAIAESGIPALDLAATCICPSSGRTMEVYTTENGVQLYTGNWLNGFTGSHGATFPARSAVCFEAQCFPDTPNKAHFPSAVLLPNDEYQQITIYKFGIQGDE